MSGANQQKLYPLWANFLGYAGVTPVLGLLILGWTDQTWQQQSVSLACSYGALILSFLGGIHWGFATSGIASMKSLVPSVAPSLWAWAALACPQAITLWALTFGLLLFYLYERRTSWVDKLPRWYLPLRLKLTMGLSLGLTGFLPLAAT
ncbi:MAG: DUF3429 domain-containing protein [Pseudomonadota bacterium]